jgi:hypothetical protein
MVASFLKTSFVIKKRKSANMNRDRGGVNGVGFVSGVILHTEKSLPFFHG